MAKHPVPKKKVSQARTAQRYAAFAFKKRRKIEGVVNIVTCESCGSPRLNHVACRTCGMYNGRQTRPSAPTETVKKIKA